MKKLFLLCISLSVITLFNVSYSQKGGNVAETVEVEHLEYGMPIPASGCIQVRLEVNYLQNGYYATSTSSIVTLEEGESASLSANRPGNSTVLSKQIRFYTGSGTQILYTQGSGGSTYQNGDFCPPNSVILMQVSDVGHNIVFYLDGVVGG